MLSNEFTAEWQGREGEIAARREELQERWNRAEGAEDAKVGRVQVGNVTGLITSIEPAGMIVRRIVAEAEAILRSRPQAILQD